MEMHQVRYFLAVAQTLNFTRAAEQCNVAQPSLTRAIKKLEDEFGGLLFHREGVRTHLTELGQIMVPYFESIYSVTASARAEAVAYRKMERAPLRLGVMSTISPARMAPFIIHVCQRIPKLDLQLREGPATGLVECMLAGELDIALLALPGLPDKLHSQPLFTERYSIAFPSGHRYEALNAIPLSELDGEDYLQRLHCEFRYHFEALGLPRNWQVNTRYRSEHEEWIQAMILAGLGCAIMPEFSPLLPGLATRIIIEPEVIRTVALVTVAGRRFSPTERAFVEATRRYPWSTLPGIPAAGPPLATYEDRRREQVPADA